MWKDSAVTEEALRMVVLEWLQTVWAPEKERDVRRESVQIR